MSDDDLRARLARLDPVRHRSADDPTASPSAHEIRERIMETIENDAVNAQGTEPSRRRPWLVAGAAASVAALAIGAAVLAGGGDGGGATPKKAPTTLALTTTSGTTMQSCVMFDVNFLKEMPVALAGTVTEVGASTVTLDVDRWYKGGDADLVTITTPDANTSVALDGVEFTKGGRFLVTATDGTVNGCGFSGPATPDLEKAFGEAFPS